MRKHPLVEKSEIKLIGIKARTNNRAENSFERGKIFPCVQRYFHQELFNKIPNKKNPGTTFCAYTDYESDQTGEYTYFIGEEVFSLDEVPTDFETLVVPSQKYAKFTAGPGSLPGVLRDAWQEVWETPDSDLGGPRRFHTDFEVYDERASDHSRIIFDIYIGIN